MFKHMGLKASAVIGTAESVQVKTPPIGPLEVTMTADKMDQGLRQGWLIEPEDFINLSLSNDEGKGGLIMGEDALLPTAAMSEETDSLIRQEQKAGVVGEAAASQ